MGKFIRVFGLAGVVAALVLGGVEAKAEEDARFSGFVDVSYSDNSDGFGSFSLDQVEIDIEKKLDDKLTLRADVQYGSDGVISGGATGGVEQGYLSYAVGSGTEISVGAFNAPIGFESLDPVDMYQFSHGLVFSNGLPTNLVGAKASTSVGESVDVVLYYVNGWDLATDNNNSKTVGGRIGTQFVKGLTIGFSGITGAEQAANSQDVTTVLDVDVAYDGIEGLLIGAEWNSGEAEKQGIGGGDAEWTAYSFMANYGVTDKVGVTLRYENFDDDDGTRLSYNDGAGTSLGVKNDRQSLTVAASYALGESAGVVFEYRTDESSVNAFDCSAVATCSEKELDSVALEFTYSY